MIIGGKPIETSIVDALHLRMLFPESVAAPEGYLSNIVVLPRHVLEDDWNKGTLKDAWSMTSDPQRIITAGPFIGRSGHTRRAHPVQAQSELLEEGQRWASASLS